jgi:hypothetical protein
MGGYEEALPGEEMMGVIDEVDRIVEEVKDRYVEQFLKNIEDWLDRYSGWDGRIELGEGKRPWIIKIDIYDESGVPVESCVFDTSILASIISREIHVKVREIVDEDNVATVVAALLLRLNTLAWDVRDEVMGGIMQYLGELGFRGQFSKTDQSRIVFRSGR